MSATEPIRSMEVLKQFEAYYVDIKPDPRNYTMVIAGLNTAFRIGDLLKLRWKDVFDENTRHCRKHIYVIEQKTGKERIVAINKLQQQVFEQYHEIIRPLRPEEYLFTSKKEKGLPLSRYQAYRIIKEAAHYIGLEEHIGCHSLRKTFGYHAWKQGTQPAMLMDLYNHSSYQITKRYLGIDQDEQDNVYLRVQL